MMVVRQDRILTCDEEEGDEDEQARPSLLPNVCKLMSVRIAVTTQSESP